MADLPEPVKPPTAQAQTAEFQVDVEGEVFTVRVTGAGMAVAPAAAGAAPSAAPAAKPVVGPGSVVAPMQGQIVKVPVKIGDEPRLLGPPAQRLARSLA